MDTENAHGDTPRNKSNVKRAALFWCVRAILILSIVIEYRSGRWPILFVNTLALALTALPWGTRKLLSIKFPIEFELLYLLSLIFLVLIEKLLIGMLVQLFIGMFLGIVGFIIMFVLYFNSKLRSSHYMVSLFSFCFSVATGAIWGVFTYYLTTVFGLRLGNYDIDYAQRGLLLIILGAGVASLIGYFYIKYQKQGFLHRLVTAIVKTNPKLFPEDADPKQQVLELIRQGENERAEFKSTLTVNLRTGEKDKRMEHAVTKTIAAFLNSDGGTLLVGVADDGHILGIEKDGFRSTDVFYRHYTKLVKHDIGNEYLPFISSNVVDMGEASVLRIDCAPSKKEVFLKSGSTEEFFVRNGPTSVRLDGSKVLAYVNQKFGK